MTLAPRPVLIWMVTACLVLVAGLVYPQTVPHAAHHAHHNAATHTSVLCAWLCAAGQVVTSHDPVLIEGRTHLGSLLPLPPLIPSARIISGITSRGPPSLAL